MNNVENKESTINVKGISSDLGCSLFLIVVLLLIFVPSTCYVSIKRNADTREVDGIEISRHKP
jgi:hypothetical protein